MLVLPYNGMCRQRVNIKSTEFKSQKVEENSIKFIFLCCSLMKMKRYAVNVGETALQPRDKQRNLEIQRSSQSINKDGITLRVKSSKSSFKSYILNCFRLLQVYEQSAYLYKHNKFQLNMLRCYIKKKHHRKLNKQDC